MSPASTAHLTLDTSDFVRTLELDVDVLDRSPEVVQAALDVLEAGHELGRIDGTTTPHGTGELRYSLHVSDAFRDRLAALRAGDVESVVAEEIDHESSEGEG